VSDTKEYVMVISQKKLFEIGDFQGAIFEFKKYLNAFTKHYKFKLRNEVENDYNYKQIIPYVIIHYNDRILSYCRGKLTTEKRLKGNYSIGIGGHVTPEDQNLFEPSFYQAMHREVNEEVFIKTDFKEKPVALINDDSNDVGKVHIGVVYLFSLSEPNVYKKEKSINQIEFLSIDSLVDRISYYENWSRICIQNMSTILTTPV
jgi:predicted NUDIX family phosphoesterase